MEIGFILHSCHTFWKLDRFLSPRRKWNSALHEETKQIEPKKEERLSCTVNIDPKTRWKEMLYNRKHFTRLTRHGPIRDLKLPRHTRAWRWEHTASTASSIARFPGGGRRVCECLLCVQTPLTVGNTENISMGYGDKHSSQGNGEKSKLAAAESYKDLWTQSCYT